MANTSLIDNATADTSATHTTTTDQQNLQWRGLGQKTDAAVNEPRLVVSVANDGSNYTPFATFYGDGAVQMYVKTGGSIRCELKGANAASTDLYVDILE